MRTLLCFASEDKQQGLQKMCTALANLPADPVNGNFQASMEALLNGLLVGLFIMTASLMTPGLRLIWHKPLVIRGYVANYCTVTVNTHVVVNATGYLLG